MYNICIFIFIIYAISYSVSEILLKQKRNVSSNSGRKFHLSKTYFPDFEQTYYGKNRTQRDVSSNSGRKNRRKKHTK